MPIKLSHIQAAYPGPTLGEVIDHPGRYPEAEAALGALASQLLLSLQQPGRDILDRWFGPGSYLGDLGRVRRDRDPEALRRLLSEHFARKAVMHHRRWELLQDAYLAWRQGADEPWMCLAGPELLLAVQELPKDFALLASYQWLRRRVRAGVERALLDGETLDQRLGRRTAPWPEEDTPEALELEMALAQHPLSGERLDTLLALSLLTEREREALLARCCGIDDAELAARDGVAEASVRDRRRRARSKLKLLRG